ncbi:glutamine amidotransferase [Paracoccus luteus]|uniref:glutamine amidotransferase n=1 Tax=Paracoccus luteus TaxID=2508543 RepID=UPI0010700D76|nr:glutamine amidotransferase [Paracoccus luteus]
MTALAFDPLLPWAAVGALGALGLLAAAVAWWRGLRGWGFRGLAALALTAALAGPVLDSGIRRSLSDIVILIEDASASQTLPGRAEQARAGVDALAASVGALPGTELRRIRLGDDPDGTLLGAALTQALAAEPEGRVAGVIAVTDGRAHDPAAIPAGAPAPVHVVLTGQPADWDRRLVIDEAPAFGLIGQPVTIRLRIEDQGAVPPAIAGGAATLRLSIDGADEQVLAVPPGVVIDVPVTPAHAGQNVVSARIDPPEAAPAQLTDLNDTAVIQIEGVRDRLRVLLVSGEPHAGERTWRNLLKSDTNVDLVHFTILRPPDKMDGVPIEELALIAFPTDALFRDRIGDFDLIIFDRYRIRGILPADYLENIRRYVEEGGAVLVASGPEMAGVESLHLSPLGPVLPGRPTGRMLEQPFRPALTDAGRRHPVTAGLPGAEGAQPAWGRWLRMGEIIPDAGAEVLMTGAADQPLLVVNRVGKGRVALLTSDQVWLWDRGFEGGGPQLELLRRVAHWSMKEPELEEESLSAQVAADRTVTVTRHTMGDSAGPVTVAGPDGQTRTLALTDEGDGRFAASFAADRPGLYRLADGDLTRLVAVAAAAPREFEETVADPAALAGLVEATGGSVARLSDGVPGVRAVRAGRPAAGMGVAAPWIGITPRGAQSVEGTTRRPLMPQWAWLALIAGLALAAWLVEGGRLRGRVQDQG